MRFVPTVFLSVLMVAPVVAQDVAAEAPWRVTVSAQIEALRSEDGETALSLAGAAFRATYSDPERFITDIGRAGYAPIATSRTHSFGTFRQLGDGTVVQEVEIVGSDGKVWEAIYQMADEPDEGWRVQGVVLRGTSGIGI